MGENRGRQGPVEVRMVKPRAARPGRAVSGGDDDGKALAQLRAAAANCRECPIGFQATQTVWGEGPPGAVLMLVGEQPGDREDRLGRPFVGPAGALLDRALADLGWPREALYVTNAVKHFKFELRGKRRMHKTPAQQEADACLHWLESEITEVDPLAIIALGATAARQLLGRPVPILANRGAWQTRNDGRRVLITLHPSALLRSTDEDRAPAYGAWLADLRQAADLLRKKP
jgi:DNA polymerase